MTIVAILHVVAGIAVAFACVASAARAGSGLGRASAWIAGLAAAVTLATGIVRLRVWESTYRRAVYLSSISAGHWLDRKFHFGVAACALSLAAGVVAIRSDGAPRSLRLVSALAALCAFLALGALAMVHAGVPSASLGGP